MGELEATMSQWLLALSVPLMAVTASPPGWVTCGRLNPQYNRTACPLNSSTCCKQSWEPAEGAWGCCPFHNATCCSNGYTYCPTGTKCQDQGSGWSVVSRCVPDSLQEPDVPPGTPSRHVLGSQVGDQVCKTGPPLPYSDTLKNVLIIGDSVSIGYTPYVARVLEEVALVQHSPWGGDGGAEETKYGAACIDHLVRSPDGTKLMPDVLMFNWGLHNALAGNCTAPCVPGQSGPPVEYRPYLEQIVKRLKQIASSSKGRTKLLFAITSPDLCNAAIDDIQVQLNAQAAQVMADNDIPTVDLYHAITNKCGPVPQATCFGLKGCYCPHCPPGYEWLANSTISPAIRKLLPPASSPQPQQLKRKNIVFIVSDDLGFNDVAFHGSTQIPTPNIDEIAHTGVQLNNYYVQPVCTPTRSSLLSGRHVIHTGIYMPFAQGTALRLHLNYTLLPEYLKMLGYQTHMIGKWHLGQNVLKALPTGRGFDSYFGYWSGAEDYYSHQCRGAYDLADGTRTAFEWNGTYSTPLWTAKAVDVIKASSPDAPFFMYLAYQNVHWPLEAPIEYMNRFKNSTGGDKRRQAVAAMVAIMDEGIGNVTGALKSKGIWDETLLIFTTDNGGPTNGNEGTSSNNFPMRGGKNTLWGGGTRGVAALRGAGIHDSLKGTVVEEKVHVSDWLRSLTTFASGDPGWLDSNMSPQEPAHQDGDGMDVWETLSTGKQVRSEVLLECHPNGEPTVHGNGILMGDWKLVKFGDVHPAEEAGWHPPPGQDPTTQHYSLACDLTKQPATVDQSECFSEWCLFAIREDPCEYSNVAAQNPAVVKQLQGRLKIYQETAVASVVPEGCEPVIVSGAWRPCDAKNPN